LLLYITLDWTGSGYICVEKKGTQCVKKNAEIFTIQEQVVTSDHAGLDRFLCVYVTLCECVGGWLCRHVGNGTLSHNNSKVSDCDMRGGESTLQTRHVALALDNSDTRLCPFHLGLYGDEHERLVTTCVALHLLQGACIRCCHSHRC